MVVSWTTGILWLGLYSKATVWLFACPHPFLAWGADLKFPPDLLKNLNIPLLFLKNQTNSKDYSPVLCMCHCWRHAAWFYSNSCRGAGRVLCKFLIVLHQHNCIWCRETAKLRAPSRGDGKEGRPDETLYRPSRQPPSLWVGVLG